jgi:lysozyme
MKPILAAIILLSFSAPALRAQDFGDMSDLKAAMSAYKTQAHTQQLSTASASATAVSKEYYHRMGHGKTAGKTVVKSVSPVLPKNPSESPISGSTSTSTPVNQTQKPDISAYPVHGIDISHYDGNIAWNQAAQGLAFVYIKSTEGGTYADPMFAANWSGAAGAGLARGAYHFYNFCVQGATQANNFIKTVPVTSGALPMVIDIEQSEDCPAAQMPSKQTFLSDLSVFIAMMQSTYGKAPVIYTDLSMYNQYLSGGVDGIKLWIADPDHTAPIMPTGRDWALWQYSWTGSVSGISSQVDMDVFNGDNIASL